MKHGSPEIVTIQKNDLDIPLHFFGSQNMGECETNLEIMIQWADLEMPASTGSPFCPNGLAFLACVQPALQIGSLNNFFQIGPALLHVWIIQKV